MKTPGQIAYEAYCVGVGGKTFDDKELPTWEELGERQKNWWGKVGIAIFMDTLAIDAIPVDVAVHILVTACHNASHKAGWWVDPKTGVDVRDNPLCFSNKVALIHSEVSEALEGDRKNKMDDHLPHLPSRDVELADALIRIADTSGGFKLQLGRAVVEKLAYNAQRADHKIANRQAEGGKAY